MSEGFRRRLVAKERMIGSFVKTAAPQVVEIGAVAGLDFLVLDLEHAPFSPADLDRGILAGKAAGIPVIVRVPDHAGPWVQQALDLGADGVIVPHVSSAAIATTVVRSARFAEGARGFSNSPRAGGYGTMPMDEMLNREDQRVAIIVQIEDRDGVEDVGRIAAVPGVDALFSGRADLAVAYRVPASNDPAVTGIVRRVCAAAAEHDRACGGFIADPGDFATELEHGLTFLVVGSDQSFLRTGWRSSVRAFRAFGGA